MVQKSCKKLIGPIIFKVFYVPGGARFQPSTVCPMFFQHSQVADARAGSFHCICGDRESKVMGPSWLKWHASICDKYYINPNALNGVDDYSPFEMKNQYFDSTAQIVLDVLFATLMESYSCLASNGCSCRLVWCHFVAKVTMLMVNVWNILQWDS